MQVKFGDITIILDKRNAGDRMILDLPHDERMAAINWITRTVKTASSLKGEPIGEIYKRFKKQIEYSYFFLNQTAFQVKGNDYMFKSYPDGWAIIDVTWQDNPPDMPKDAGLQVVNAVIQAIENGTKAAQAKSYEKLKLLQGVAASLR
jgi:hypothetical protein